MAKMREDWLFIERLLKMKVIDLQEAKRMMGMPLYHIVQTRAFEEYYNNDSLRPYGYLEGDFILKDFAVVIEPMSHDAPWVYAFIEVLEDTPEAFCFNVKLTPGSTKAGSDEVSVLASFKVTIHASTNVMDVVDGFFKSNLTFKKEHVEVVMKDFRETIASVVVNVAYYTRFSQLKDQYMIGVSPTNAARKKSGFVGAKDILFKASGPRVIYLNEMPKTKAEYDADRASGVLRKPHPRRGFFKTLKADRYKHHPLYLKEKAIYTRPTWIGDKEKVVDGNVYTILETTT